MKGLRPDEVYGIYKRNLDAMKRLAGIIPFPATSIYCKKQLPPCQNKKAAVE